jgi:hypothetical protein
MLAAETRGRLPDPSIWHAFALFSVLGIVALGSFIKSMRGAVA